MKALFELLDELRESGTMNMFGAPRWLLDNDLVDSKEEAREVFKAWTEHVEMQFADVNCRGEVS